MREQWRQIRSMIWSAVLVHLNGRALQAEGPDAGARLAVAQGFEPVRKSEHGLSGQYAFGIRRTHG
jgi:hypothetical protein